MIGAERTTDDSEAVSRTRARNAAALMKTCKSTHAAVKEALCRQAVFEFNDLGSLCSFLEAGQWPLESIKRMKVGIITEEAGQFFCVGELCGWVPLSYVGVAQKILSDKVSCLDELVVDRVHFRHMIDKALRDVNKHKSLKVKEAVGRALTVGMQCASVRETRMNW